MTTQKIKICQLCGKMFDEFITMPSGKPICPNHAVFTRIMALRQKISSLNEDLDTEYKYVEKHGLF